MGHNQWSSLLGSPRGWSNNYERDSGKLSPLIHDWLFSNNRILALGIDVEA